MCYYIKPESNSFVIKIVLNFWFFIYYLNVSDGFFILALVGIIKNINHWVIYLFISFLSLIFTPHTNYVCANF